MFKKILFATSATEASDHAARVAFNIAAMNNAQLNIFHVLGVPTRGYSQDVLDVKTKEKVEADDEYVAWVKEEVATYYEKQIQDGMKVEIDVAVGFPHREILRQARDIEADLILLGRSTGEAEDSVYKKSIAGSTIQRVLKAARCPVMMVSRPAASFWGGVSNIVCGTDFSKSADRAFEFAASMARALDGELHVFHALDISPMLMGKALPQDTIEHQRREAFRRIRGKYLPGMEGISKYTMEVWEGIPFVEIVKYAREQHADLIVMAHHSRKSEAGESTLGSNMEQVIVRAGCPVISMNR
ncbi:MAG: universal stress protein [Thermodesulfobacteriota bacterium]|nr:universal stress protein [Thermodesulfobacteriota bacterium]